MKAELKSKIIAILLKEKKKEYLCHIQYVVKIALSLAQELGVDISLIETACWLHDIGRGRELPGEKHAETGKRMAEEILRDTEFTEEQKQKIYSCILSHNSQTVPLSIEEQIVRTADGGSKIEYHEAFMLLCRKETYEERLVWGIKYLEDGFSSISIDSYRRQIESKYVSIIGLYNNILRMI
jgi:putative nucleotidyltransferase with HDIG domain